MELEEMINNLDNKELEIFLMGNTNDYYRYIKSLPEYQEILLKLDNNTCLSDEEWKYLFDKLYLVTCKSIGEEYDYKVGDRIICALTKCLLAISKKRTPVYNEAYKLVQYIESIRKNIEIDEDLLFGLELTKEKCSEEYLDILLRQHEEAEIFRGNKNSFYKQYDESIDGRLSGKEIVSINSFNRGYERERELVLKYTN